MKKNRDNYVGIIIAFASLLLIVLVMYTWNVFGITSRQTREVGIYQLTSISGELESTISEAEILTMEYAIKAQKLLGDKERLRSFIYEEWDGLSENGKGCYNMYVAGRDWDIFPHFSKPVDFITTERRWYKGALKNKGTTYVSSPYVDAMTGNICYTVSVMLGDSDTVLGVDYTLESIQAHITELFDNGPKKAVIVTEDGIIAGCSDESLIGRSLSGSLPEYSGIFSMAKSRDEVAVGRVKADIFSENLFATRTGNGWYLIVSVGDWDMYRDSYLQLSITLVLSLALFTIIILLYISARRNQKKAEHALNTKEEFLHNITDELREPLSRIIECSSKENTDNVDSHSEQFARIHDAGARLYDMIGQIISYSSIIRTENKKNYKTSKKEKRLSEKKFRTVIIIVMSLVMVVSLYTNLTAAWRLGNSIMQNDVDNYEYQLSHWIDNQKSILDMFSSIISTNPDMLNDYEGTVEYLNRITIQYPEISASYMSNPSLPHTIYMNNGWEPESDWKVEERQWYKDTLASESGWSISSPYYDEQTGLYCITFSERVYNDKTGEFLGNFGIDFYMDKLVEILGSSYTDGGYAFLVDSVGTVINHPYGSYQLSQENTTNISELSYGDVNADGNIHFFNDYDDSYKIMIAQKNEESGFSVYVVSSMWKIYGKSALYGIVCFVTFLMCIIMIYRILTNMMRWQEKTNRQMKAAADSAIAAGKAKSQFLAQMSHEIRTPINAVLGMNEMILRESKDEAVLDYSSNIQTAGRTLLALINSILDFSKIEDGKMEIIPIKYDLAAMVNNLVNSISERAKAKGLMIEVEVDETLPSVLMGDDVRISQVIMNLLTNAVKYTEEGSVTLIFRNGGIEGDYVDLDIDVRDTGIGIKEEDMGRLFESFERIEELRNRNIEGTGLGMSIVTKLLGMMNSRLKVNSTYGMGSSFSFRLRQLIVDETPVGDYNKHKEDKRETGDDITVSAPDAKVLIVDDNVVNLKVAKNLMKLCKIAPDTTMSGKAAVELVKRKKYHIIYLDHMMPVMDGIETLKKMREENLLDDDVTVIALTANAVVGARETYLEAGFDDYISKPIDIHKLVDSLIKYLPEEIRGNDI